MSQKQSLKFAENPPSQRYASEKVKAFKNSRRTYIGKITQNKNKITDFLNLNLTDISSYEQCLAKIDKYLAKIKYACENIADCLVDQNEINENSNCYTEQNFRTIEIKNSVSSFLASRSKTSVKLSSHSGSRKSRLKSHKSLPVLQYPPVVPKTVSHTRSVPQPIRSMSPYALPFAPESINKDQNKHL